MKPDLPPNTMEPVLVPPKDANTLHPEAGDLFKDNPIDRRILRRLAGQSIVGVADLAREEVIEICKLAAVLEKTEIAPYHPLDGKIAVNGIL